MEKCVPQGRSCASGLSEINVGGQKLCTSTRPWKKNLEDIMVISASLLPVTSPWGWVPGGKVTSKFHSSNPTFPVVTQVEPHVEITGSTQYWYPMPGVSNRVQWTEDASTWILKDISQGLGVSGSQPGQDHHRDPLLVQYPGVLWGQSYCREPP